MCGHSKRRCGFVRYGLSRAGKCKLTNDPTLAAKLGVDFGTKTNLNNSIGNDEKKLSKYSKRNTRMQFEKQSQKGNVEIVGLSIEKLEFGMEKKIYNETIGKNWSERFGNGKKLKKWHRNHRDNYSTREIDCE